MSETYKHIGIRLENVTYHRNKIKKHSCAQFRSYSKFYMTPSVIIISYELQVIVTSRVGVCIIKRRKAQTSLNGCMCVLPIIR
jgi:hypothetical protein